MRALFLHPRAGVRWLALFLTAAAVPSVAAAQYAIEPAQTYMATAELCTLSVVGGEPGDSLGCVEIYVSYDPAIVTPVEWSEGGIFEDAGGPGLFFYQTPAPATISVEGCLLGFRTFGLAPGEVARFVFRADAPGVSQVHIELFRLWDIDRVSYEPVTDPSAWIFVDQPTGARPPDAREPVVSARPNPFHDATTLEVSGGGPVDVAIYDASGRCVRRFAGGSFDATGSRLVWDGRDERGRRVASGVYFAAVRGPWGTRRQKLVCIR